MKLSKIHHNFICFWRDRRRRGFGWQNKRFSLARFQKSHYLSLTLLVVIVASVFLYVLNARAAAVNCYWVGDTSPAIWNDATHWASSSGGTPSTCDGGIIPGTDDIAYFTSANTNSATIDINVDISGLNIGTGYTGTIAPSSTETVTLVGNGYVQDAGTFTAPITLTINNGNFTKSAGTFNEGTNTVVFTGGSGSDRSFDVATTETLYNVTLDKLYAGTAIASGDTMVVDGTLTLSDGSVNGPGIVNANGAINQAAGFDGGTARLNFAGDSTNQTYTIAGGAGPYLYFDSAADASDSVVFNGDAGFYGLNITSGFTGTVPMTYNAHNIIIYGAGYTQDAGTFTAPGTLTIYDGNFIKSAGIFNEGTNTIVFIGTGSGDRTFDVVTTETLYNVTLNKSIAGTAIASGDTMVIDGTLTLTNGFANGPGIINANGAIDQGAGFDGGNARLNFAGDSTNQTYTIAGGSGPSLYFDSTADANDSVVFNADASFNGLTITSGFGANSVPMTYNGYNLTIQAGSSTNASFNQEAGIFVAPATLTLGTYCTFNKTGGTFDGSNTTLVWTASNTYISNDLLNFYAMSVTTGGGGLVISSGSNLNVNNTFTMIAGNLNGPGTVNAQGNVTIQGGVSGGDGFINFNGTGDQTYSIAGVPPTGTVTMSKSSGFLKLENTSTTARTLTLSSSAQNSGGNLTVATTGTGGLTLAAATNNPAVTVPGNLTFTESSSGAASLSMGSNTWTVGGNVDLTNGTITAGTSTLILNGAGAQTITSASQSLYNLASINASASGVSFADSATVTGTFTDVTASSKLTFDALSTYAFANININGQALGTKISMLSNDPANPDVPSRQWYLNVTQVAPQATYVNVTDSDANGGNQITANSSSNGGNNENWVFPAYISSAPTIGAPQVISATSIRWTFTDTADNETGFKVYDGSDALKATCATADLTFCDETGLTVNTLYNDRYVVAYNDAGNSAHSGTAAGIYTLANTPSAPTVNNTALTTSLTTIININSNPASTEFAISCDGDTTFLNYSTNACEAIANDADHWRTYTNWGGAGGFGDTGLLANTNHTYKAMAKNGDNTNTALSSGASKYTLIQTPTGITFGAVTDHTIALSASGSLSNINVGSSGLYFSETSGNIGGGGAGDGFDAWTQTNSLTDTGLTINTTYSYKAKARNGDGTETVYSSPDANQSTSNTLQAPSNVTLTADSTTQITVNWTDNSSTETGNKVYISTVSNADCSLATYPVSPNYTTAADAVSQAATSLAVNSQYCAKVIATNGVEDTAAAYATLPKYTLANVPSAPTVNPTSSTSLTVIINVNSNPDPTQFAIYNQTASQYVQADGTLGAGAVWQTYLEWGGAGGIANTGLTPSTSYTYEVKARNGDNTETAYSVTASAATLDATPTPTPTPIATATATVTATAAVTEVLTPAPTETIGGGEETTATATPGIVETATAAENPSKTSTVTPNIIDETTPGVVEVYSGDEISGTGTSGAIVELTIIDNGHTYSTKVSNDGTWKIKINENPGEYQAKVKLTNPDGTVQEKDFMLRVLTKTLWQKIFANMNVIFWVILVIFLGYLFFFLFYKRRRRGEEEGKS